MATNRETRQIPLNDISKSLENTVTDTDRLRANGLEGLHKVRRVKEKSQKRELARLSQKLGDDHPRVVALQQKVTTNQVFIRNLGLERDRAQIDIPIRDDKAWTLYGFVRDQDLKGLPNLTVALYSKQGKWIESLGFACTNKKGYFKLVATSDLDTLQRMEVFVRVLDQQRKPLYIGQQPLTPALGQVDYREIIISSEPTVCPPPEPGGQEPSIPLDGSVLWFQRDSVELRQDDEIDSVALFQVALRRIQKHLEELGDEARIVLHGYASTEGDEQYNLQLSQLRAEVVRTKLVEVDIPENQIIVEAHGEDATYSTLALNRRVEIELSTRLYAREGVT